MGEPPLAWKTLSSADASLAQAFSCDKPGTNEVVEFIRFRALSEQEANFSTTFIFMLDGVRHLDAYVTLSAAGMPVPPRLQSRLGTDRRFIPSVMIDYIGVDRSRDGQNVGFRIFEWVQERFNEINAYFGVRFIVLGVRAANWGAYGLYLRKWGFTALPVKTRDGTRDAPDPTQPRPEWLDPEVIIHLYYDLVERNGAYVHS